MADARERYAKLFAGGEGTDRIQFFSDAVFAIAMTLLVLDIKLPAGAEQDTGAAILSIWRSYLAYGLSFLIIGLHWVSHHRKFRVIVRFDRRLVAINLAFLAVVAFMPFPTSVIAQPGDATGPVVLYAGTAAVLSLLQLWLWMHAYRAGLTAPEVDRGIHTVMVRGLIGVPLVFLVSIPFAFVIPQWTPFLWILMRPVEFILNRTPVRD